MENIKFSTFDVFAYFLPGSIILGALVIYLNPNVTTVIGYASILQGITLSLSIVIILISYIIGNVSDNFGSWLHYKVGCKVWGEPYPKSHESELSHAKQRALVRQYSPENFSMLRTWKVLKTMSHNISFSLLLVTTVSFIRFAQHNSLDWLVLGIASLVSGIILLQRATIYDKWHYKEMIEMIEILALEQRVSSEFKTKSKK